MKSVGYLFLGIYASYCYSNNDNLQSRVLENYARICRSAESEQTIIKCIDTMHHLTIRDPYFFFYPSSKRLCAIALYDSACNENVSDLTLIKKTLESYYSSRVINKAIRYLAKEKMHASDFN